MRKAAESVLLLKLAKDKDRCAKAFHSHIAKVACSKVPATDQVSSTPAALSHINRAAKATHNAAY
eukprot:1158904-Pelagomonas_calceolata.AAC.15